MAHRSGVPASGEATFTSVARAAPRLAATLGRTGGAAVRTNRGRWSYGGADSAVGDDGDLGLCELATRRSGARSGPVWSLPLLARRFGGAADGGT